MSTRRSCCRWRPLPRLTSAWMLQCTTQSWQTPTSSLQWPPLPCSQRYRSVHHLCLPHSLGLVSWFFYVFAAVQVSPPLYVPFNSMLFFVGCCWASILVSPACGHRSICLPAFSKDPKCCGRQFDSDFLTGFREYCAAHKRDMSNRIQRECKINSVDSKCCAWWRCEHLCFAGILG